MAEDAGVAFFSEEENTKLVAEYAYIAHFMGVPLEQGETHERYAEHLVRTGRQWQLRHQIRKLWGKD